MWSVAALNGNAVTESSGLWILVGADAVVHRLCHPVVHLAALGLDPDLFKNVNTEVFVAGICFLIQRLDLLKDHRLERCALRGGLRGEGNRASPRANRAAAGARSARMRKLRLLIC